MSSASHISLYSIRSNIIYNKTAEKELQYYNRLVALVSVAVGKNKMFVLVSKYTALLSSFKGHNNSNLHGRLPPPRYDQAPSFNVIHAWYVGVNTRQKF